MSTKKIEKMDLSNFTFDQVAEMLKKSESTIYNYTTRGKRVDNDNYVILQKHPSKSRRILKEDLIRFKLETEI